MAHLTIVQTSNKAPDFIEEARRWIRERGGFDHAMRGGEPALQLVLAHLWDASIASRGVILQMAPALVSKI